MVSYSNNRELDSLAQLLIEMVNRNEKLWGKPLSVKEWQNELKESYRKDFEESKILGALNALKSNDNAFKTVSKDGSTQLYSIVTFSNTYLTNVDTN